MSTAKLVCCIVKFPIRTPAIIHDRSCKMWQYIHFLHGNSSSFAVQCQIGIMLIGCIMYPSCFTLNTGSCFIAMKKQCSNKCFSYIRQNRLYFSAQRVTIFFIVPVESGILKILPMISCTLFTLTAPTVFKETTSASRFFPYWT